MANKRLTNLVWTAPTRLPVQSKTSPVWTRAVNLAAKQLATDSPGCNETCSVSPTALNSLTERYAIARLDFPCRPPRPNHVPQGDPPTVVHLTEPGFLRKVCGLLWVWNTPSRRHPLPPLLAAWASAQTEPAATHRVELPALHRARMDNEETKRLLRFDPEPETCQLVLPGIGGSGGGACPAWLLDLYDTAGGQSMTRGRGAQWPLRLFVGAMLHAPLASRDGHRHGLVLPAREVIRWLHPNRWRNQASRWYQFPEALRRLDQLRVYIPGLGRVRLVAVNVIPTTPHEYVAFELLTPSSASRGARLDWMTLTDYGRRSAPLYRGYLAARTVIDHTARHGIPLPPRSPPPSATPTGDPSEARMVGYSEARTVVPNLIRSSGWCQLSTRTNSPVWPDTNPTGKHAAGLSKPSRRSPGTDTSTCSTLAAVGASSVPLPHQTQSKTVQTPPQPVTRSAPTSDAIRPNR